MPRTPRQPPVVTFALSIAAVMLLSAGCAAGPRYSARVRHVAFATAKAPARLDRSYFPKPYHRQNLAEEVIQRVIAAPIELEARARAGLVVLDAPFSRKRYTRLMPGDELPQKLARRLEESGQFTMVTDISPHLVRGQELEALRELAVRYRLKYLVILNRRFVDRSRVNPWGWTWLSLLAIPFAPAYSLRTAGLVEATLMDVKTGTFLFTTQVHVAAERRTTPWHSKGKLLEMQIGAAQRAVTLLADTFLSRCRRIAAQAKQPAGPASTTAAATGRGAHGPKRPAAAATPVARR